MTTEKKSVGKCPLCKRPMIQGPTIDAHHLIPKSEGGRHTVADLCHVVCHRKIHSTLTEQELAMGYHTWEALRGHEQIRKFIRWVKKKDPEYIDVHKDTKERSKKRKKR